MIKRKMERINELEEGNRKKIGKMRNNLIK
jgi:hypothetical protein